MIKNKKIKSIIAVITATVAVLAIGIVMATALTTPIWSDISLNDEYDYGSELVIPERTVSVSGETASADCIIIYPDGTVASKDKITLNISGVYTLRYSATVNGGYFSIDERFLVSDDLYAFSSGKSSAVYDESEGLKVTLAEGDTMYFNPIIDLSDITAMDTLINVLATPVVDGQSDFERLYFTFTDVEDPTKTLTISARQSASTGSESWQYTYLMVAGNGQVLTGVEPWNGDIKKHVEGASDFGRPIQHSFVYNTDDSLLIQYDAKTKAAYVRGQLIAELGNPEHFSMPWSGFTSNKVRLSISGAMYDSPTASFLIKSINGIDLSLDKINDSVAPTITVNTEFADNMPLAEKGMQYTVPTATAKDANTGVCNVKTSVWYNYASLNRSQVTVKDGKFETSRIGSYAIVYEASDKFGNTATKILWVTSKQSVEIPSVEISQDRDVSLTLGEVIQPADYTASASSGNATVKISVKFEDKEYDLSEQSFRPEKQGTYTVVYTATDYIGQTGTSEYEVVATPGAPVFVDFPSMPKIFVSDVQYALPEVYINDYSSGQLERKMIAPKVTDKYGTRVASSNKLVPAVENSGDKVTVVYEYQGAETVSFEIPAIKAWDNYKGMNILTIQNYLYSSNGGFAVNKTDNSIGIIAEREDASWLYANTMVAEQFELVLASVAGTSNYDALKITLTDVQNQELSLVIRLVNNGSNNAEVQIGELKSTIAKNFVGDDQFVLTYSDNQISVGEFKANIEKYENGENFEGFPSGKIYFEVAFEGAENGAQYDLVAVNGHRMTNLASDLTAPKIVVLGEYGGTYRPGDTVILPASVAGDTLDPNTVCNITVTAPDGTIVTSVDGVKLDKATAKVAHSIKVDTYGQYAVKIYASETYNTKNNSYTWQYAINVGDDILPEASFADQIKDTATVGDTLILPDFTVSDNMSSADKIRVGKFVYTPSGRLVVLEGDSNSIVASQAGIYEFRVYVCDEAGNLNLIRLEVTVKEGGAKK